MAQCLCINLHFYHVGGLQIQSPSSWSAIYVRCVYSDIQFLCYLFFSKSGVHQIYCLLQFASLISYGQMLVKLCLFNSWSGCVLVFSNIIVHVVGFIIFCYWPRISQVFMASSGGLPFFIYKSIYVILLLRCSEHTFFIIRLWSLKILQILFYAFQSLRCNCIFYMHAQLTVLTCYSMLFHGLGKRAFSPEDQDCQM